MGLYLALDAGGTKTRCWVADERGVRGTALGGTVKLMNVDEQLATERIRAVVLEALAQAGAAAAEVNGTCIGLAGISGAAVRRWAETALRGVVRGELLLAGDEEIALAAAFQDGPGVLVIAGTGSHVVGRTAAEARLTAGGWGPVLGDEGSGHWIGLEAVRASLRARDRGQLTSLLSAIEHFWGLRGVGELVACGNRQPRPAFAELTALVAGCAEGGDAVARDVLRRAGESLAGQVGLVLQAAQHAAGSHPATQVGAGEDVRRVAWTGSVLEHIATVREVMVAELRRNFGGIEVDATPVEPLEGALWRARRIGLGSSVRDSTPASGPEDFASVQVGGD